MTQRSAVGIGRTRVPLGAIYAVMLFLLYLPVALLFVFSFNANTTLSFPITGLTTRWYGEVFSDAALLEAAEFFGLRIA